MDSSLFREVIKNAFDTEESFENKNKFSVRVTSLDVNIDPLSKNVIG
jgi:hypothetical protein